MKKIFSLTVSVVLLFSCSRDYNYENFSGIDLKAKKIAPEVFVVEPNGVDDTPALCQAFEDAKAAGPGSVVQLVAGEYNIGLMEVRDFYGKMIGAGRDVTVITAMNNLDLQSLWDKGLRGDLVKFVGGEVYIGNFSIQTPEGRVAITGPPAGHVGSLINFSACNAQYEAGNTARSINVVIDNVSFRGQFMEGGIGYINEYNCYMGVRAGFDDPWGTDVPREKINFTITNSEFNTCCYGLVLEGIKDSQLIVGTKNEGNTFNNLDMQGGVWESRGVDILVEGNTYNVPENHWGFDIDDYWSYGILREDPSSKATLCNIQSNVFNLPDGTYGLCLFNWLQYATPGEVPIAYQVKNNQFNIKDYPVALYSYFTKGAVIRNNKFSGYGYVGLWLDYYSEGGLVLGNNFSTADFGGTAVYLTRSTKDWSVVGGDLKDKVVNLGTGNIITGMNVSTSEVPLGHRIRDILPQMNHLMK